MLYRPVSSCGATPAIGPPPFAPKVNPGACTDPDSHFVLSTLSQQAQSGTLAVLLIAKAVGRAVNVRVLGSEPSRPAIVGAYF